MAAPPLAAPQPFDDGDPYGPTERRRSLVSPWVWWVGAAVGVAAMAYAWWPRSFGAVPVLDEKTSLTIPDPGWNGYAPMPKPEVKQVSFEPDQRIDTLMREVKAIREEDARLRAALQELQNRPTATKAQDKKPPPPHRHMGYLAFEQPEKKDNEEPLYALAPGDTKLSCTVEAKQNSDVESVGTLKITTNIFDSESRRRLLIPQGSTLLVKYQSRNLLYGAQRLPEHSAILTLPNGTPKELNDEPVMDQVGQAGLVSSVDNHFWRAIPAVIVQGVLRGSQQTISNTGNPFAAGVAGSAAQYGQRITQPYIDLRPTILVEAGEDCIVILTRTIKLPEYREKKS